MLKVEELRKHPMRKSLTEICFDDGSSILLSRRAALAISRGDEFEQEEVDQLQVSDQLERAWPAAARFLEFRDRTVAEVRSMLATGDFLQEVIDFVVERLIVERLLDDERFARNWVENRSDLHPRSHRMIRRELMQKGIDEKCIARSLGNAEEESELARRLAEKLAHRMTSSDFQEFQKRVGGALARKGFSYSIIRPILLDLWESKTTEK